MKKIAFVFACIWIICAVIYWISSTPANADITFETDYILNNTKIKIIAKKNFNNNHALRIVGTSSDIPYINIEEIFLEYLYSF
tara:strand:+ start:424 stop:672 length:249 start_codon:yes stop_codon:yes gene_type:complete